MRVVRIMADALHELVESVWTDGFQHLCVLSLHTLLAENLIKAVEQLQYIEVCDFEFDDDSPADLPVFLAEAIRHSQKGNARWTCVCCVHVVSCIILHLQGTCAGAC